jgi:hypothetical protein
MSLNIAKYSCKFHFAAFLFGILHLANSADAQVIQVPNLSGFGNDANLFPFGSIYGPMRYQQIYAASEFPQGGAIDKIMFRNDDVHGTTYGLTDIDVQVAFAYAATSVGTISTSFADNIGDDFTVVLDAVISESNDGSAPPDSFDFALDVANTFIYDPSQGDLLVQFLVRDINSFTYFDASDNREQAVTTRLWALGVDTEMGEIDFPQSYGLVTQFQFVPEPSTIAQFGVMLLLVSARRRGGTSR